VLRQTHDAVRHSESVEHACQTVAYAVHVLEQKPDEQLHFPKQSVWLMQYWLNVFILEHSDEHVIDVKSQEHCGDVVPLVVDETVAFDGTLVVNAALAVDGTLVVDGILVVNEASVCDCKGPYALFATAW
jgi:hypothetical protein